MFFPNNLSSSRFNFFNSSFKKAIFKDSNFFKILFVKMKSKPSISWKDRSELLGYYNEFTKKFNETEFLRAVYESTYRKDLDLIVLDEMNLARIEYYFAEFLSMMEMPNINDWLIELTSNDEPNDPKNIHKGKLLIPQNIEFFGTANNE